MQPLRDICVAISVLCLLWAVTLACWWWKPDFLLSVVMESALVFSILSETYAKDDE